MEWISGTVIQGTFKCRKNEDNSRELEVEILYRVFGPDDPPNLESEATLQIFTVR